MSAGPSSDPVDGLLTAAVGVVFVTVGCLGVSEADLRTFLLGVVLIPLGAVVAGAGVLQIVDWWRGR